MFITVEGLGSIRYEDGIATMHLADGSSTKHGFNEGTTLAGVTATVLSHVPNEQQYAALELSSYLSQDAAFIRRHNAAAWIHRSGVIVAVDDGFSVWYSCDLMTAPEALTNFVENKQFFDEDDNPYKQAVMLWVNRYAVEEIKKRMVDL